MATGNLAEFGSESIEVVLDLAHSEPTLADCERVCPALASAAIEGLIQA